MRLDDVDVEVLPFFHGHINFCAGKEHKALVAAGAPSVHT